MSCMIVLLRVCEVCWWCWLCAVRCVLCVVGWRCVCLFVQAGQGPNCICKCAHLLYTRVHTTSRLGKAPTARCMLRVFCVLCLLVGGVCVCSYRPGKAPTALASAPICYIPGCTLLAGWARPQLRVVCCVCCACVFCVWCLCVGCACAMCVVW